MPDIQVLLNADDLSRVRLLSSPDPIEEMALAAHRMPLLRADPVLGGWARRTVMALGVGGRDVISVLNSAFVQVSDLGHGDPTKPRTIDEAIEAIRSLPRSRWGAELEGLTKLGVRTDLVRGLTDSRSDAIGHLESALRAFHRAAIAPHWSQIETYAAAGRDSAATRMAEGGVEELLSNLHPTVTWKAPLLTMSGEGGCPPGCVHQRMQTAGAETLTFIAEGRGLILVPSVFFPVTTLRVPGPDDDEPLVMTFPVRADWHLFVEGHEPTIRHPLADLMGSTRALVLEALSERQLTTSSLARRIGISAASASEHAAILRAAKMVASVRDGNRVIHSLTVLGNAILISTSQTAFSTPRRIAQEL